MIVGIPDSHSGNAATRTLLKRAAAVQRAERHVRDRFIGTGDECVENRQHAVEVLLLQIDFHVFGYEVGRLQRGFHRVLEVSKRGGKIRNTQRIRRRPHCFLPAKHIHRGARKKLIDIKKIWPAEHVELNGNRLHDLWEISLFPCVQFLELAQIKF